jgi:tetratricopeptide (TPR) repeat protein
VLAEQAVDFARRGPGRRSLAAADAMLTYGHSLQVKGDARRARAMLEAAIAVYRTHPDSARPRLAASLVNLGFLDDQEERFDSAEIRMRESLAIRRAILAPDDPKLLNSIAALAGVLLNTGAVAEAERLAEEAVAMGQSIYPDGHPRRATLAAQLAEARDRAGKPADAERRYRESLEALRTSGGGRTLAVAGALNHLGLFLHERRGDARSAEAALREAAGIYAEVRGPAHTSTALVESNLAEVLLARGRLREADTLLRRAVTVLESGHGPEAPSLATPLLNLGVVLLFSRDFIEAETLLRRAVAVARATAGRDALRISRAESALGAVLVELGRTDEAEPLLLGALERFRAGKSTGPYPGFTANALVRLYTTVGRPDEASKYRPAARR